MSEPIDHAAKLRKLANDHSDKWILAAKLESAAEEIDRLRARVAELEDQVKQLTPPPSNPSIFERELATYERHKGVWLAHGHEGKYVVIKDNNFVGPGCFAAGKDSYEDALRAGYQHFGPVPFMVKQVLAVDPVLHMRPG